MEENIECGDFIFFNNFDSANLAKVEKVDRNKTDNKKSENSKTNKSTSPSECPSDEFNLWTKQDCHGTEFQNNNRTWFYFGIKAAIPGICVRLNIVNLNKQLRMFNQGMSPVYKVIPGQPHWKRIKEKPTISGDEKSNEFILSFNYKMSENSNAVTYFAFTYPFSYTDLQNHLKRIDTKMLKRVGNLADDIYYHKECAIKSLEGRRVDVLTISSFYNILPEREARIKGLFPEEHEKRSYKFRDKKVIFLSARVHPGETPSSFVLNGFLNFILNREEPIAIILRRLYVFKLIPMLNPDGVSHGYYRMDTKGVNLNRLYLNPSKLDHPTIYAAKTLLRYYHNRYNLPDEPVPEIIKKNNISTYNSTSCVNSIPKEDKTLKKVNTISFEEKKKSTEHGNYIQNLLAPTSEKPMQNQSNCADTIENIEGMKISSTENVKQPANDSGIFLYIDFHGHASKKGIFMYGNHFDDPEEAAACMLLPKLMSLNNPNFHFTSCNFAEKNMYLIDKRDGLSREGSGRVAVYKLTGLIYSYTLECNYNTGRLVNTVPPRIKEGLNKFQNQLFIPPKYSPMVFEEVGAALGPSILDMTGNNPNSRLPNSHYRSLKALQAYLKLLSASNYQATMSKPLHKNNAGDQFHFSQDSTVDKLVKMIDFDKRIGAKSISKSNLKFPSNSCEVFGTPNIFGTIRKIKKNNNNKRHFQTKARNIQRNVNESKKKNLKTETVVSQIISTHVKSKSKQANTAKCKQIQVNTSTKYLTRSKLSNKVKPTKPKVPIKNTSEKSKVYAKRTMIRKQGSKKLKTIALTRIRHQFKKEFGESSLNNVANLIKTRKNKKNSTIKVFVKKQ